MIKVQKKRTFKVDRTYNLDKLIADNTGTYEIEMTIKIKMQRSSVSNANSKGEEVEMYYNLVEKEILHGSHQEWGCVVSKEFPAVISAPIEGDEIKLVCCR